MKQCFRFSSLIAAITLFQLFAGHLYTANHVAAAPAAVSCQGTPSRLSIGNIGRNVSKSPNRLRANHSTDAAQSGSIQSGDSFLVIGGPECANGYTWIQVFYAGRIGWTAEGKDGVYFAAPIAQSAAQAAGQPIAARAEIEGLTNGFGGDSLIKSACTDIFDPADTIKGFVWDIANNQYKPLSNGLTVDLAPGDLSGQSILAYPVEICSTQPVSGSTVAYAGQTIPVTGETQNGITSIRLPDPAYDQPGSWTLTANGYTLNIVIPTLTKPTYNFLAANLSTNVYTVLLGGFKPNEQVVMVVVSDNNGDQKIDKGEYSATQLQVNEQGAFVGSVLLPTGLSAMVLFVGNAGSVVMRGASTQSDLLERVRDMYWKSPIAPATTGNTGGFPGSGPALIFYQQSNTSAQIAAVAQLSLMQGRSYAPSSYGLWTHITGLRNRLLIYYNTDSGAAAVGRINLDGSHALLKTYTWTSGFTHMVGIKGGLVLLYNASLNSGSVIKIEADGSSTNLSSVDVPSPGYTHVIVLPDGRILLYRSTDGATLIVTIATDGTFQVINTKNLSAEWTNLAVGGDNLVLFYNAANGIAITERIGDDGSTDDLKQYQFETWTHIVGSNGSLVFYNANSGRAVVGVLNQNGEFTQKPAFIIANDWNIIASTQ